jgi:hypothetical protein
MPTPRVDYTTRPRRICEACPSPLPRHTRSHTRTCSARCRKTLWNRERARQVAQESDERFPGSVVASDHRARPEVSYSLASGATAGEPRRSSSSSKAYPGSVLKVAKPRSEASIQPMSHLDRHPYWTNPRICRLTSGDLLDVHTGRYVTPAEASQLDPSVCRPHQDIVWHPRRRRPGMMRAA